MSKPCPHCGPLPVNHLNSWFSDLLDCFFMGLERKIGGWNFFKQFEQGAGKLATALLERVRIISYEDVDKIDRGKIYNRTLVLLDEAKKRGIRAGAARFLGRYNNHFFVEIAGKKNIFQGLPGADSFVKPEGLLVDDKAEVKRILENHNFPTAAGRHFWRTRPAQKYGVALGFPLVVKPRWGSISRHVFIDIRDQNALAQAIRLVQKISPSFVVEKYLRQREVYRATLVNFKLGGVVKRIPANVVGDGVHNVCELLETKNSDPRRGEPKQKDCTFLKIVADEISRRLLSEQGLSFDSVPQDGQRVFLQEKVILDLGADLVECSDAAHPDNISLFEKVAQIFGAKILGIDFLCGDIATSWKEQECAIIELNSLPFIDMHHFPSQGQPRNIAGFIWDMVEGKVSNW
ncbi:MAG: hypothetical protein V1845_02605 [bacterium]